MKLVTKYQISAINSCWEKCDEKYLGMDGRTDRGKTVERGYNKIPMLEIFIKLTCIRQTPVYSEHISWSQGSLV